MWKVVLLVLAVAGAGAGGFLFGVDHTVKQYSFAVVSAQAEQHAADERQASSDAARARQEYKKRLDAATLRNIAHDATARDISILVPAQRECVVRAPAMKRLNDPDLVGDDARE